MIDVVEVCLCGLSHSRAPFIRVEGAYRSRKPESVDYAEGAIHGVVGGFPLLRGYVEHIASREHRISIYATPSSSFPLNGGNVVTEILLMHILADITNRALAYAQNKSAAPSGIGSGAKTCRKNDCKSVPVL
jgi:hypothetical protein